MLKTFVIHLEKKKQFTVDIIHKHVQHLSSLDAQQQLVFAGPYTDGSGGVVIVHAETLEEATVIASSDPFVMKHFEIFTIREVTPANRDNNYLLNQ